MDAVVRRKAVCEVQPSGRASLLASSSKPGLASVFVVPALCTLASRRPMMARHAADRATEGRILPASLRLGTPGPVLSFPFSMANPRCGLRAPRLHGAQAVSAAADGRARAGNWHA